MSEDERLKAIRRLAGFLHDGTLKPDEHRDRQAQVEAARTREEIAAAFGDLQRHDYEKLAKTAGKKAKVAGAVAGEKAKVAGAVAGEKAKVAGAAAGDTATVAAVAAKDAGVLAMGIAARVLRAIAVVIWAILSVIVGLAWESGLAPPVAALLLGLLVLILVVLLRVLRTSK